MVRGRALITRQRYTLWAPGMPATKPGSKPFGVEHLMKQRENWRTDLASPSSSEMSALSDLFATNIRLINYRLGGSRTTDGQQLLRWNLDWMVNEIHQGVRAGRISKSAGTAAIRTAIKHTKQGNGTLFGFE